jgi:hypothetical protein
MMTEAIGDLISCKWHSLPLTTSGNVKSGARVPKGSMEDGVFAMMNSFLNKVFRVALSLTAAILSTS